MTEENKLGSKTLQEEVNQQPRQEALDRTPKFDLPRYLRDQINDALTSLLNWHGTCEENHCTREYVSEHQDLLIMHYNLCGGGSAFAENRSKYLTLCEHVGTCRHGQECKLALAQSDFEKCPLQKIGGDPQSLSESTFISEITAVA